MTIGETTRAADTKTRDWRHFAQRYALLGAWIAVAAVFSIARPETFATGANIQTILGSQAVLVILALALMIPLLAGDFDLSVAFLMGLCAMVVAKLNADLGWPLVPSMAVALALGLLVGLINGWLVVVVGVDSLIVTLGIGTFLLGITELISDSNTITGVSTVLSDWVVNHRILGVSVSFWYGLLLCVILWIVLEHTAIGARLLFVGRNRNVARLSGISVQRLRLGAFIASDMLAALAGIVYVGGQGGVDVTSGQFFLLPAFAAAFLGATAILPGRFNARGTFMAVYFLVTGITGLQLLGVASFVQDLFYGAALVVAVTLSAVVRRKSASDDAAAAV
jgi:ribose transport system permease protein